MSNPWHVMRSYPRTDPLSDRAGLAPGTLRRVVAFARPHRRSLLWFLLLVVLDAFLVVATPLLFRTLIDDGVAQGNGTVVTVIALVIALVAFGDAGLTLGQRWYSARIGEGL